MRVVTVAAAQMGPIQKADTREAVVERMCNLMREAKGQGADLVAYPELALTTFFPRWYVEGDPELDLDSFYETEMPGPETKRLFARAAELEVGFCLGYAELTSDGRRFNTQILVERDGSIVGSYHKVHLPGHREHEPWREFQHLERRYFEPGDSFDTWNAFGGRCRWPSRRHRRTRSTCRTNHRVRSSGVRGAGTPATAHVHDLSLIHI